MTEPASRFVRLMRCNVASGVQVQPQAEQRNREAQQQQRQQWYGIPHKDALS